MDVFNKFPNANDRKLSLGDSNGYKCNCPNHPNQSHASMSAIDVDYYTTNMNHTQYAKPIVNMWEVPGIKLIPGIFDVQRNAHFLQTLRNNLPEATFRTNNLLLAEMLKIDPSISSMCSGIDFGIDYNHYTHFHIDIYKR